MNTLSRTALLIILKTSCMSPSPHYEYADGSGNRYTISTTSLEYIPVKPEESSSGTYSGGEPGEVTLTMKQYNALQQLFEKALNRTEIHTEHRAMMSGLLVRTTHSESKKVILKPGALEIEEIESALRDLLAK